MSISIEDFQEMMDQKPELLERDKQLIIETVNKLGCTYPSEISKDTLIPRERTTQLIYQLIKEKLIFRLFLNPNYVPIELLPRMNYFWSIGIHGFESFQKMMWLTPKAQIPLSEYYSGKKEVEPLIKVEEEWIE